MVWNGLDPFKRIRFLIDLNEFIDNNLKGLGFVVIWDFPDKNFDIFGWYEAVTKLTSYLFQSHTGKCFDFIFTMKNELNEHYTSFWRCFL